MSKFRKIIATSLIAMTLATRRPGVNAGIGMVSAVWLVRRRMGLGRARHRGHRIGSPRRRGGGGSGSLSFLRRM